MFNPHLASLSTLVSVELGAPSVVPPVAPVIPQAALSADLSFAPAKTFVESKAGVCFQKGTLGVVYYEDTNSSGLATTVGPAAPVVHTLVPTTLCLDAVVNTWVRHHLIDGPSISSSEVRSDFPEAPRPTSRPASTAIRSQVNPNVDDVAPNSSARLPGKAKRRKGKGRHGTE